MYVSKIKIMTFIGLANVSSKLYMVLPLLSDTVNYRSPH